MWVLVTAGLLLAVVLPDCSQQPAVPSPDDPPGAFDYAVYPAALSAPSLGESSPTR